MSVEWLVVLASLYWAATANLGFFGQALRGESWGDPRSWSLGAALVTAVVALQAALLALVCNRWTAKPVLAVLIVVAAVATHYMNAFGVVMDPTMMRNLLRTHPAEAGELIGPVLIGHLVWQAGLPLLLLWRVRVVRRPWGRALAVRLAMLAAALALLVGSVLAQWGPLSSLTRNQRDLRYRITPANVLWSMGAVLAAEARGAARPRQPIGLDAKAGPSWAQRRRPLVVVLVVGETARAADWGLNAGQPGYAPRDTTPQLARLVAEGSLVNLPGVKACGTNTETSLPCMFAPGGRRDYDEDRIRGQQSLLHVVARAGVQVHWRDNQSGCKGVCEGLPNDTVRPEHAPALCPGGRCFDEAMLHDLDARLAQAQGTHLLVLHMMGSHGPAYHRRAPPAFKVFQPACEQDELRRCSDLAIRNAYDNTLRYTDHVLVRAIAMLRARADRVDSALVFVSDHGESLGERGLYLHGMPYAVAPEDQLRVPMVAWFSPGLDRAAGLAPGCVRPALAGAPGPVAHDHLFHTLLGLLDVRTALHEPTLDLVHACRRNDP